MLNKKGMEDYEKLFLAFFILCILLLWFVIFLIFYTSSLQDKACSDFGGKFGGDNICIKNGIIYEIANTNPWGLIPRYEIGRRAVDVN